jgi:hypothetical protein
MKKTALAVIGIVVLIAIVIFGFAAGYFNPATSSNLAKENSEAVANEASSSDSSNNTLSSPTPSPTPIPIPVEFKVNNSQTILTVKVDLNDGMSREEAILVAQQLFPEVHSHATYELKSADVNDAGVWTVSLPWGAVLADGTQENHSHYFIATIDPTTLTIQSSTCY